MHQETKPADFKGWKVLVVEDETLISMLFEDLLLELECEIVGPALNIGQATQLAGTAVIDAAVLDVNLAGKPIYPVAEILSERGIPFLFSSGYGADGLPTRWKDTPTLPKPFTSNELATALQQLKG